MRPFGEVVRWRRPWVVVVGVLWFGDVVGFVGLWWPWRVRMVARRRMAGASSWVQSLLSWLWVVCVKWRPSARVGGRYCCATWWVCSVALCVVLRCGAVRCGGEMASVCEGAAVCEVAASLGGGRAGGCRLVTWREPDLGGG